MSYDDWPPKENHQPPIISNRWQNELNRLAGFAPNGYPHLRLEWGCTTTWTAANKDLKYLYKRQTRQTGWGVHVYNDAGEQIKTLRFKLNDNIPPPDKNYGVAFPINIEEEIGIARYWISQYIPPSLVGPWDEARFRTINKNPNADMGSFPREGMYYLGFHLLCRHDPKCCTKAKDEKRKCFGYFRPPSDLDILYVSSLIKERDRDPAAHDWTESASDNDMYRTLKNLNNSRNERLEKEREEMKLRIRDAFKTHKGRFTSRKGKSSFIFLPDGSTY